MILNILPQPTQDRVQTGFTYVKYTKYISTLAFNDLACQIAALFQIILGLCAITSGLCKIEGRSRWAWWDRIVIPNSPAVLYLGALPLKKRFFSQTIRDDAATLARRGIQSVLSVAEPFETTTQSLFYAPVTPQEWRKKGIDQYQLSTPDFGTISLDKIQVGVALIHEQVQQGRPLYIHCKAGRGRSFLVLLCYLMTHHGFTAEGALQLIKSQRRQANLGGEKWATAKQYEALLREQPKK